jgi:hypothetical protein
LAAGVVLTMVDGAYLPLLGIIAAPILAGSVRDVAPQFGLGPSSRRLADAGLAFVALLATIAIAIGINARANVASERVAPYELIERLAADGRPHVLYCSFLEWCDYAIGSPNVRVWMDGRVERASLETRDVQRIVARVETGWPERLRAARIDALVVRRSDALATLLALSRDWSAGDGDESAQLFLRRAVNRK